MVMLTTLTGPARVAREEARRCLTAVGSRAWASMSNGEVKSRAAAAGAAASAPVLLLPAAAAAAASAAAGFSRASVSAAAAATNRAAAASAAGAGWARSGGGVSGVRFNTTSTATARANMGLTAAAANTGAVAGVAAAGAGGVGGIVGRALGVLRVYHDLSKFKLSAFVVSTTAAGYVLGSGESIDWQQLGWTSLGTMLCSSSANTFNQVFEVSNDSVMARTMRRPLPTGRCSRLHAVAFGVCAGAAGVGLLQWKANETTAALGAFNILLYAGCYTPLKQVHWLNTWVGAVVGSIPPLMGWAAARGALEPAAGVLAAALYFWQMPHFMALAYMGREDYMRGGYRMLSHTMYDPSGRRLAGVALRNAVYLLPLGMVAVATGLTTAPFAYEAAALALPLALSAAVFYRRPSMPLARAMFFGSLLYLPVFQSLCCFHRVPRVQGVLDPLTLQMPERWWAYSEWSVAGWTGWEGLERLGTMMEETSSAPFPFLPPPLWPDARCPHKADCQGGAAEQAEEEEERQRNKQKHRQTQRSWWGWGKRSGGEEAAGVVAKDGER